MPNLIRAKELKSINEPSFTVAYLDEVTLITFSKHGLGEVADTSGDGTIDEMFYGVFARLSQPLVIDISAAEHIPAKQIALLSQIMISHDKKDIARSIVCAKPVQEVFEILKLNQVAQIFPTVSDAIRAVTGQ